MAVECLSHPPSPLPSTTGPGASVCMTQGVFGCWRVWCMWFFGHISQRLNAEIGLVWALMQFTCKAMYVLNQ